MSCNCPPTPCVPCTPLNLCQPENFGLAFPSLVGPMGPPGGPGTYVENYDELRAIDPTSFTNGYVANVGGYETFNDGGEGQFVYMPLAANADNDGTILSPANGIGRWFRSYSGPLNVQWFGARNDGDVSFDNAVPINSAISVWLSQMGGFLLFPHGTFNVLTPVVINPTTNQINSWGILSQGAVISAGNFFVGDNVFRIVNSPNCQLRDFVCSGGLLISGSTTVGESVVLIDGSGTAASVSYTAFYKSVLRDIAVQGFGFPLASTGGTAIHAVIIRGNFHESLIDAWRLDGDPSAGALQGDGFRFEDGPNFVGGFVGLLRIKNAVITASDRAFYQVGSKFDALFIEDCGSFLSNREAVRAESSSRIIIRDYHAEDAYNSNANNADFTIAAVNIVYGGAVENLYVRGNGASGQAKVAVSSYGVNLTLNNVTISGTCTKTFDNPTFRNGSVINLDINTMNLRANKPRMCCYGRTIQAVGIQDVVYTAMLTEGFTYAPPTYAWAPNMIRGAHLISDIAGLLFVDANGRDVLIDPPCSEDDRGDQVRAANPANELPIVEGHRFRMTLLQNHPTYTLDYVLDSIYVPSAALPALTAGQAVTIEWQFILGSWLEITRSAVWTP